MSEDGDRDRRGWSHGRDALASYHASLEGAPATGPAVTGAAVPGRSFRVGTVLSTGCAVWGRNLVPFLLITALFYAPPWIWAATVVHGEHALEAIRSVGRAYAIATYLTLLLNVFVAATLTYGVVMELNGQRATIGACIATGLTRFLPALGVGVSTWLCVGLASMALLLPGILVLCMLYVATPVSVVERPSMAVALSRSADLTKGRRWRVLGLILVVTAVNLMSLQLVRTLAIAHPETIEDVFDNLSRLIYISFVHHVITGSLSAVMTSVAYYHLRADKEGTSTAELAAIFE
jgi:hypothetical protein